MIRQNFPILVMAILLYWAFPASAQKASPDITLQGHTATILDLAFSPDGKQLASVGDDGSLKIWDLAAKKELLSIKGVHNSQNRVRFMPDGKSVIALGDSNQIAVFDPATGKPRKAIPLSSLIGGATGMDLSPDGKTVAVVGRSTLRLYDVATGNPASEYAVHKGYGITGVAYASNGKIATISTDNTATVIDAASGKILHTYPLGLNGACVTFSIDGKTLFVGTTDRVLRAFDVEAGPAKTLLEPMVPIMSLAASQDGKMLIVGGPGHWPWIVKLPEGSVAEPMFDSEDWVKCAAISQDGQWLAGGGNQGSVFLWKMGK